MSSNYKQKCHERDRINNKKMIRATGLLNSTHHHGPSRPIPDPNGKRAKRLARRRQERLQQKQEHLDQLIDRDCHHPVSNLVHVNDHTCQQLMNLKKTLNGDDHQ